MISQIILASLLGISIIGFIIVGKDIYEKIFGWSGDAKLTDRQKSAIGFMIAFVLFPLSILIMIFTIKLISFL